MLFFRCCSRPNECDEQMTSTSDSSDKDGEKNAPKKLGRRNIRKLIADCDLSEQTKEAGKREEERKKRIAEKQKLVSYSYTVCNRKV